MLCDSRRLPSLDLFLDENIAPLGPRLASHPGAGMIRWVGHPSLPNLPLGTKDPALLQFVGQSGVLFLTHDRHMRSRPAERKKIHDASVRMVLITARGHHALWYDLIIAYWEDLVLIDATAGGPCLFRLNRSGVHQSQLRHCP